MNSPKKPLTKYCWDTSVFLAWLNQERNAPLNEIDLLLSDFCADPPRAILVFPVTVYAEVLHAKHSEEQIAAFDKFLLRSSIVTAEQSMQVSRLAQTVRSRGIQMDTDGRKPKKGQERSIKASDALIIATAMLYDVDAFHSLEPKHLRLSGSPIVDGLRITKPVDVSGQLALSNLAPN